jgi:hypothetical protein
VCRGGGGGAPPGPPGGGPRPPPPPPPPPTCHPATCTLPACVRFIVCGATRPLYHYCVCVRVLLCGGVCVRFLCVCVCPTARPPSAPWRRGMMRKGRHSVLPAAAASGAHGWGVPWVCRGARCVRRSFWFVFGACSPLCCFPPPPPFPPFALWGAGSL